jgi:hypothetical protein
MSNPFAALADDDEEDEAIDADAVGCTVVATVGSAQEPEEEEEDEGKITAPGTCAPLILHAIRWQRLSLPTSSLLASRW